MTPLEALAGRLYEAARHTGGRIAAGAEPWERVGPKGREAWLAVATEARAALSPRVVTREQVAQVVGFAWDDGNAVGLDGYTGAGRGDYHVDPEAEAALARAVERAVAALLPAAAPQDATREQVEAGALALLSERFDPVQAAWLRDSDSPTWAEALDEAESVLRAALA